MHKIKRTIEIISKTVFLIVLFSCSKEDPIDCTPFSYPDCYEYPIKPGTQEWIDLESRDLRAQVSMIPEETLRTISTGGLFESLLNYPFILDYVFWDKMQNGFTKLKSENPGFTELYSRNDLYEIIYKCYSSKSLDCSEWIYHPFNTSPVILEMQTIEFFIFQDEFLNRIHQGEVEDIFKLIFNTLKSKNIHKEIKEFDKLISAAILGKIMYKSQFEPFVNECNNNDFIKFFIEYIPNFRPENLIPTDVIQKYAADFYNKI